MSDNQSDNSTNWDIPVPPAESTEDATDGIPVNLTEGEWQNLIHAFVERYFIPESVETFEEAINNGRSVAEAAYDAIRNEAANDALAEVVYAHQAAVDEHLDELMERDRLLELLEAEADAAKEPLQMIWVTFRKEGIHAYPAAATDPALKTGDWDDVSFLASPHRHIFHFRVEIEVFHDDRDLEFIQLKRWCERLYEGGALELNSKSCEMLSNDLHAKLAERWPGRLIMIEVSEDGENGSKTVYPA